MPWWSLAMGCRWPTPTGRTESRCRFELSCVPGPSGSSSRPPPPIHGMPKRSTRVPGASGQRASSACWRRPSRCCSVSVPLNDGWWSTVIPPLFRPLLGQDGRGKAPGRASGFSPYVGYTRTLLAGRTRPARLAVFRSVPVGVHWLDQAELTGLGGGVSTAVDTELGQDPGDMDADCLAADEQLLGDLPIGATLLQQCQHFTFPRGQPTVTPRMWGAHSQVQPTSAGQPLKRPLKWLGIESHRGLVGSHGRRGRFRLVTSTQQRFCEPP